MRRGDLVRPGAGGGDSPALAVVNQWLLTKTGRTNRAYAQAYARVVEDLAVGPVTVERATAIRDRLAQRYAPATVALTLSAMRSLWKAFQAAGLVADNPWAQVPPPPVPLTVGRRLLTEAEVAAMIRACPLARDRALLAWLYYTGMRVTEAVTVRWQDLRWDPDTPPGRWLVTIFGKGGKTRTVTVPDAVVTAAQHAAGPVRRPQDRLWPLSTRQVERIVARAAAQAGVPKAVSPHWLRHAYATHALRRGAPLPVVQHALGHARLDTTGVYLDIAPGESAAAWLPPPGEGGMPARPASGP